jgi:hypothetical protein
VECDGQLVVIAEELTVPDVPLERILRTGMIVAGTLDPDNERLDIRSALLPASDALAEYALGDVVLALVAGVDEDAARLRLYPQVDIQVPRSEITSNDLDDLRTLMTPGEILAARVTSTAPDWQLSLIDVDDDEVPRPAPSLIDGGPPWIELADQGPEPDVETIPAIPPPIDLLPAEPEPVVPTSSPLAAEDSTRVNDLRDQLKAGEVEIARLRSDLSAVRQEHHLLKSQFDQAQRSVEHARRQLEQTRSRLRKAGGRRQVVRDLPEFADPEQRFRIEVTLAWASRTPLDEQRTRPLPEYSIGPSFLDSVGSIEGISRDKIAGVVFEVLTGRAQQMPSRELHQLRENETGNAPVVRRLDGAVCWRVSMQSNTPQARRLHYWQIPGGRIELSRVVLHDDFRP